MLSYPDVIGVVIMRVETREHRMMLEEGHQAKLRLLRRYEAKLSQPSPGARISDVGSAVDALTVTIDQGERRPSVGPSPGLVAKITEVGASTENAVSRSAAWAGRSKGAVLSGDTILGVMAQVSDAFRVQQVSHHEGGVWPRSSTKPTEPEIVTPEIKVVKPYWAIASLAAASSAIAVLLTLVATIGVDPIVGAFLALFGVGLGTSTLGLLVTAPRASRLTDVAP